MPGMSPSSALGGGPVAGRYGEIMSRLMPGGGTAAEGGGTGDRVAAALTGPAQQTLAQPLQTALAPAMAPIEQARQFVSNPGTAISNAAYAPIRQIQDVARNPVQALDPLALREMFGGGSQSVSVRGPPAGYVPPVRREGRRRLY